MTVNKRDGAVDSINGTLNPEVQDTLRWIASEIHDYHREAGDYRVSVGVMRTKPDGYWKMAETKMEEPSYTLAHPIWHMHASGDTMSMLLGVIPYGKATVFAVLQRSRFGVRALLYLDDVTAAAEHPNPRGVSEVVQTYDEFRRIINTMLLEIRHCITEIIRCTAPTNPWLQYGI